MKDYLLLLHDDLKLVATLSPSDMQGVVEKYSRWAENLAGTGRLAAGHKLRDEGGKRLRRRQDATQVTDGPYAELSDIVAGVFVIKATDYPEACQLASDCPHLEYGWIEVREIEPT